MKASSLLAHILTWLELEWCILCARCTIHTVCVLLVIMQMQKMRMQVIFPQQLSWYDVYYCTCTLGTLSLVTIMCVPATMQIMHLHRGWLLYQVNISRGGVWPRLQLGFPQSHLYTIYMYLYIFKYALISSIWIRK